MLLRHWADKMYFDTQRAFVNRLQVILAIDDDEYHPALLWRFCVSGAVNNVITYLRWSIPVSHVKHADTWREKRNKSARSTSLQALKAMDDDTRLRQIWELGRQSAGIQFCGATDAVDYYCRVRVRNQLTAPAARHN